MPLETRGKPPLVMMTMTTRVVMRLVIPDLGAMSNLLLLQEGESGRGRGRGRGRGGFRGRSNFRGGRGGFRGGFRFVIDNNCRVRVGLGP